MSEEVIAIEGGGISMRAKAPRRGRSWWDEQYRAWRESGQTKAQFCQARGLNIHSFDNWCRKLRQGATAKASGSRFIQANVVSSPGLAKLSLMVGDVSVRFEDPVDAQSLAPWVQALRAAQ